MNIKCGHCGQEIVVADDLADGQHILCPYCDGELVYEKPTRTNTHSQGLHVIRPNRPAQTPSPVPDMTSVNPRRPIPHPKRNSGEHPIYYSIAIAVAALSVAGIMMLRQHQNSEAHRQEELARQQVAQQRLQQEEQENRRREERERRAEAERERAKKAEQERANALAAQKLKESVLRERQKSINQIREVKFDYLRNCPENERPQSAEVEMTYDCIVPQSREQADVYKIVAVPKKEMTIERYDADGARTPVSPDEFKATVKKSAYVIIATGKNWNGKGWIGGEKNDDNGIPIVNDESSINPAREDLGLMYDFLRIHSARRPAIGYAVYFGNRSGKRKLVRRVNFGIEVSANEVRSVIFEELQAKAKRHTYQSQSGSGEKESVTISKSDIDKVLFSGNFYYSSDLTEEQADENVELTDSSDVAALIQDVSEDGKVDTKEVKQKIKENIDALKQKLAENDKELKKLRKNNPACLDNPESDSTIRPLFIKRVTKEQSRYYTCREVTYVRIHFHCTACDREHDVGPCKASLTAYRKWREAKGKIERTLETNEKIDALCAENESIEQHLEELTSSLKNCDK